MAEFGWTTNAATRLAAPASAGASCRLEESGVAQLFQVMARRGRAADCLARAAAHFGAEPPARPGAREAEGGIVLLWSGPDQFLVLRETHDAGAEDALREALGDAASVSNQSDARVRFRVTGQRAGDALAKLSSVDLHPQVFARGALAQTAIDHTNVSLWRGEDDSFNMLVFSSFADSLWHATGEAVAEFRR